MFTLYAIHDPWFHGLPDGDVDDRGAFCVYDRYLQDHPLESIRVYVGNRLEQTLQHYSHLRVVFTDKLLREEIEIADEILICAPLKEAADRQMLMEIMELRKNGYSQGCKVGSMNFPNHHYLPLLESVSNPYSTVDTMITFPIAFIEKMDPLHSKDYTRYGCIKLFSPGAVAHIPGLLYRLYCPEIGGGPGTNMLSIQRILQQRFGILPDVPIDKDHFIEFNQKLLQSIDTSVLPIDAITKLTPIPALIGSLAVMTYFANLVYITEQGPLYQKDSEIYSLQNLPKGDCLVEDPPPLYDLVAAHAALYGFANKEEILSFYDSIE